MLSCVYLQGLQYENVNLGPPKPPCNDDRLATLRELDCTSGPSNPELGVVPYLSYHIAVQSASPRH